MTRIVLTGQRMESVSSKTLFNIASGSTPRRKKFQKQRPNNLPSGLLRASSTVQEQKVSWSTLMASSLEQVVKPTPWTPKLHHTIGLKFLLGQACAGLLADPGMGKTAITLAAIKELKAKRQLRRVLVIAPLRPCYLVWPKERAKWTAFATLRMEILHGPQKAQALARTADIYVINPDGLQWLVRTGQIASFDT